VDCRLGWAGAPPRSCWVRKSWIGVGTPVGIKANRIERRVNNTKGIPLRKDRVLINDSGLNVVDAFQVRDVRAAAHVGQAAILTNSVGLKIRDQIREGVVAPVVIVLICRTNAPRVKTVVGLTRCVHVGAMSKVSDFRTLIGGTNR